MNTLLNFYNKRFGRFSEQAKKTKDNLRLTSILRLLAFVLTIIIVYFLRNAPVIAVLVAFLGMALFLYLVKYHEEIKDQYRQQYALTKINATEIKVLQYQFQDLPSGEGYENLHHDFSHDLDLFGQDSFFQYANRSMLPEGRNKLAAIICRNDIEEVSTKQKAIQELADKLDWRQEFMAKAALIAQNQEVARMLNWLHTHSPFVPKTVRWLPWLFSAGTVLMTFMVFGVGWPINLLVFWIVLGLGISAGFFKKIMVLATKADQVKAVFGEYSKLLLMIEEVTCEAQILKAGKKRLSAEGGQASHHIKRFSGLLNKMDYNNNIFYAIFGNGCFLGALQTAYQIEQWIAQHKDNVPAWFDVIALFDAWNSLGNFSFNHPSYSYPSIQKGGTVISCRQAGHPLLTASKSVRNDFEIADGNFFIVTGSNMAGKSTFLRTIGLMMVMGNMGLPVCAETCSYAPVKLVTSMRSIDSLSSGESYFLSELKRLKFITDLLQKESYFVVLDEILKGTNSDDKALGSKKFLEKLVKMKATGLLATHDLSLCKTSEEISDVHNYYFDAIIKNHELHFDYRLKKGINKTANASFLLEKLGIV